MKSAFLGVLPAATFSKTTGGALTRATSSFDRIELTGLVGFTL